MSFVLVVVGATTIFGSCESASLNENVSSSSFKAKPHNDAQSTSDIEQLLRKHGVASDTSKNDEQGAGGTLPVLRNSFSEKMLANKAATLTKSKSVSEISRMNGAAFDLAAKSNLNVLYKKIEDMGFNPNGMKLGMLKCTGNMQLDIEESIMWAAYTKYWKDKYPFWKSKLQR
ncbi:hypothetical protein F441_13129 [Phytophthora nicotianae CJ01A1]|uniref:RxLR effector protein n=5 Tax=Phytophthora nicotianae TaxID=4792 RepID=W2R4F4_PHYN3|nr:hypothetical protein PPTG_03213 [Phytophthora nicotianae INRA-310]ETI41608.1 hypothetical protein F443_13176 [Phytophthora nicotianae P1569]ETK81653.1 hypothetical protein L915_12863 [Phytophthora nicotianae]ETO70270.1 hypothetical protein F444_13247 [Phytophthora nicotianae P1976]ETP11349.1 hypothetical protein F441_13129 [Phytophthora nicotianae CJ01A1]KUF83070.1 hypothetical protein AM587_10006304 [Phytophthora nicotianae]